MHVGDVHLHLFVLGDLRANCWEPVIIEMRALLKMLHLGITALSLMWARIRLAKALRILGRAGKLKNILNI